MICLLGLFRWTTFSLFQFDYLVWSFPFFSPTLFIYPLEMAFSWCVYRNCLILISMRLLYRFSIDATATDGRSNSQALQPFLDSSSFSNLYLMVCKIKTEFKLCSQMEQIWICMHSLTTKSVLVINNGSVFKNGPKANALDWLLFHVMP